MKKSLLDTIIRYVGAGTVIEALRKACYFLSNIFEALFGVSDSLEPPRCMSVEGRRNYSKIGNEFLGYFVELGGLKKTDRILDVGSGIGRMSLPIARYLSKEGSYEGIDIINYGVRWCQKKITPRYPNVWFQRVDVYNKTYHRKGKQKASEYKFPYGDDSFDFVLLTSVFTHMLPVDLENYLSEISRVLKKDGKCLITYFLLNDESLDYIEKKQSRLAFNYWYEECRIEDKEVPEVAIAYEESRIRKLYEQNTLKIVDSIHYGAWCGREKFLSFQDIIVAQKL
ncbi:MAG: class I SAM-dependent methyltransferase [Bacteroidales bacterium]|nr:class I SAM-dependent methyltransferase [Bacteroidales bacterium]